MVIFVLSRLLLSFRGLPIFASQYVPTCIYIIIMYIYIYIISYAVYTYIYYPIFIDIDDFPRCKPLFSSRICHEPAGIQELQGGFDLVLCGDLLFHVPWRVFDVALKSSLFVDPRGFP